MDGRWTIKAFDTTKRNKKETPVLKELAFENNSGIMEIAKFYSYCEDPTLVAKMDDLIEKATNEDLSDDVRDAAEVAAGEILQDYNGAKMHGEGPWTPGYRERRRKQLKK